MSEKEHCFTTVYVLTGSLDPTELINYRVKEATQQLGHNERTFIRLLHFQKSLHCSRFGALILLLVWVKDYGQLLVTFSNFMI